MPGCFLLAAETAAGDFVSVAGTYLSLVPPIVAIVLAVASRTVILPLAAGVFSGAILLSMDSSNVALGSIGLFASSMWMSVTGFSHLQALLFSLLLGAMVGVLEAGGAMKSLVGLFAKRIRSRTDAQSMIAFSGLAIFFDDYANTLLVGGTMRSSADRYGLSREKLAYLVDSTAAPIAGLSVVSTWAAIEIGYMSDGLKMSGLDDRSLGFQMFIQSIPYRFYPLAALFAVFVIARTGRDFGPMRRAESQSFDRMRNPASTKQVDPNDVDQIPGQASSALWMAAVLPIVACIGAVGLVLVQTGISAVAANQPSPDAQEEPGILRMLSDVLGNGDSYLALIVGGGVGLIVAIAMHRLLTRESYQRLGMASLRGAMQMMPAMLILWFAWALSGMTEPEQLDTGGYLAGVLSERMSPALLPTVVFLLAGAMAFSTGTSWGTMGILTPLSVSLAVDLDPVAGPLGSVALATSGAVLAGAIFGDHCSPISDTTVLSSRASGCDHLAHVKTQLPYALTVACITVLAGTIPVVLGVSPWICLLAQMALIYLVIRRFGQPPGEAANG